MRGTRNVHSSETAAEWWYLRVEPRDSVRIDAKRERRSRARAGLGAYCSVNRSADKGCIESNPIPRLASEKGSPRRDNEHAVSKYEGHKANLPNFCSAHSRDTPS